MCSIAVFLWQSYVASWFLPVSKCTKDHIDVCCFCRFCIPDKLKLILNFGNVNKQCFIFFSDICALQDCLSTGGLYPRANQWLGFLSTKEFLHTH